jgi:hypothetical protein
MGKVMVKCKNPKCGKVYPSGIGMDRKSFENPTNRIVGHTSFCPFCKSENVTNKEEMTFQE